MKEHRLYDENNLTSNPHAQRIADIVVPALEKVVEYCKDEEVDLNDAMGYCHRSVGLVWARASISLRFEKMFRRCDTKQDQDMPPMPLNFEGSCSHCGQVTQSHFGGTVPCKWGGCNGEVILGPVAKFTP